MNKSSIFLKDHYLYKISLILVCFSFLTSGLGNTIFKIKLPFDISTLGIYTLFLLQLLTRTLTINKYALFIFLFIVIQTFIYNFDYISFVLSFKHFLGLFLFVVTIFSFVSNFKHRITDLISSYFSLSVFVACFSIFQLVFFLLFNISIIPQNFLTGENVIGTNTFIVEVFDFFPRGVGFSTEPANFSVFLLPSVYIALKVIYTGEFYKLKFNYLASIIIILAFILSFSLVGYFGLFLILLTYFFNPSKINKFKLLFFSLALFALFYLILQSPLGYKISSFIVASNDIANTEYTTNEQTTFALVSNFLVAKQSLLDSYFLGSGLNSHQISYSNHITNIFSISNIPNELNKENAGSLFIRILSEFGIPGILFIIGLLTYNKCKQDNLNAKLNELSLIFLLTYMFRTGHYISNIFIFFLAIYIYTYKLERRYLINLIK
jgi:hypothetical protein